jgi:hypothetical protein
LSVGFSPLLRNRGLKGLIDWLFGKVFTKAEKEGTTNFSAIEEVSFAKL